MKYIVTYDNYEKQNVIYQLKEIRNNMYILECGSEIPLNHLFTHLLSENEYEEYKDDLLVCNCH